MNVVITEAAWADMLEIGRTIMADNPVRAGTFIDELYGRCLSIGDNPKAFPLLPEYEDQGIRRRVYGNYLIFYRVKVERVEILHVLHGARDFHRLLFGDE